MRGKGPSHSPYSNAASTVIAKVLEKPEPGSSCPVTRSPSPQPKDPDFLANNKMNSVDTPQHHVVYKSSDLYCSDTALYCPMDDRQQDRRQGRRKSVDHHGKKTSNLQSRNSLDSNPEDYNFHSQYSHNDVALLEFAAASTPACSSFSSFSMASDEKGLAPSSPLSSSHLALYMDRRDGDYECKSTSSYDKDSLRFPRTHSFQHMTSSSEKGNFPVYMRTASSHSEPYHSSRPTSSYSMGSSGLPRDSHGTIQISEEELLSRWRHLSVEDINNFSYHDLVHVSPYSFSEQHFAFDPSKIKLGPLYGSVQEGDNAFYAGMPDSCFSISPGSSLAPSPNHSLRLCKTEKVPMYQSSNSIQESKSGLFLAGISKDSESILGTVNKEYVDVSPNSSTESLHQTSVEASNARHHQLQSPGPQGKTSSQHQKFTSTGLSRKDSLTKAQLYGTLLN